MSSIAAVAPNRSSRARSASEGFRYQRLIAFTLVSVVVGAVANLAVAAACAMYGPILSTSESTVHTPPIAERRERFGTPTTTVHTETITCVGYQYCCRETTTGMTGGCVITMEPRMESCRAGWPLHAFAGVRDHNAPLGDATMWKPWGPVQATSFAFGPVVLQREFPVTPVWMGLAVNSSVFALTSFALLTGVGMARRHRRLRAGLCIHCKYPAGPSPVCTECGHTLPARHPTLNQQEPA